ncbi:hypothetical protein NM688_g6261 [Phlebia brevispora]|uniref:Uncharacterized protein n=1 Tax=Phlebia brevispora TaxID=194682 RepID=A0ACC1SHX6_9APHY|nr:hypothetical protein NM688_g6261 [Phlebia brevispora]
MPNISAQEIKAKNNALIENVDRRASSLPPHTLLVSAFALGIASTLATTFAYRRFFKRIPNGGWITPDMFNKRQWIKGRVVSVGDADNFRIYHTPGIGWRWPLKFRSIPVTSKDLKDQTIPIRMAGVDAPEGSHFGRPGQLYYEESLAWLKSQIEGKTVYCEAIGRDQYSRIVAMPYLKPRFLPAFLATGKCLSLEMLRAGWAMTYQQAGADYGKWGKDEFLRIEAEAKAARRGMWKDGTSGESPAEYKRRYAGSVEQAEAVAPKGRKASKATGWIAALAKRLLQR